MSNASPRTPIVVVTGDVGYHIWLHQLIDSDRIKRVSYVVTDLYSGDIDAGGGRATPDRLALGENQE